jgi:hypothetical protein
MILVIPSPRSRDSLRCGSISVQQRPKTTTTTTTRIVFYYGNDQKISPPKKYTTARPPSLSSRRRRRPPLPFIYLRQQQTNKQTQPHARVPYFVGSPVVHAFCLYILSISANDFIDGMF